MAGAREHRPLRMEALLEHVRDRIERGAVGSRDHELEIWRRRQLVERDLGLVRRTLRERGTGAGLDQRRKRIRQLHPASDEAQEELEVAAGIPGRLVEALEELLDRLVAARDPEGWRLEHDERSQWGRTCRGRERDDPAVRVPDEVVARLQQLGDLRSLRLEVDRLERPVRR